MTRTGSTKDSFTGRAGQLAVLSELLIRGVNAAIPEVDEGEDTLAFGRGGVVIDRIQVKSAKAEALKTEGCYAARVSIPLGQLQEEERAPLYYAFAVRFGDQWSDFVIIARAEVFRQSQAAEIGHVNARSSELQLRLSFSPTGLKCSDQDWSPFRNAWESLPVFQRRSQEETA